MTSHHDESPAVVETRLVHDTHRRATSMLADAATNLLVPSTALAEFRDFVTAMLEHHHRSEDHDLWPLLAATGPGLADDLAGLTREHEGLDAALDRLGAASPGGSDGAFVAAARALRDLVHSHLDHEEPILFPALRSRLSDDDWSGFSQRTVASTPAVGKHLLVELLHQQGSADEVDLILRHLPADARLGIPALREAGRAALAALHPIPGAVR